MPPPVAPAVETASPTIPSSMPALRPGRPRPFSLFWFGGIHLACLAVLWVGVSPIAVGVAVALFAIRMFAVTATYHRLFSHRSFETSRPFAFLLASVATTAVQKGPIWWASVHRHHHRYSDLPEDVHSPVQRGFWWSHMGWILAEDFSKAETERVRDLTARPELVWLDKWHFVAPLLLSGGLYALGAWLGAAFPALHTSGAQLLVWGMAISLVVGYHATWSVNSVVHVLGKRRFQTTDDSRNNWLVAIYTFGEGWHNNHHRYQASERQGFYPGEYDITHWVLTLLSKVGLVWDLKVPPETVLEEGREQDRKARTSS
jgi:stearoyl-CoA desaturase (delta-9 desaturase)